MLISLLLCVGCDQGFRPETLLSDMRLLGVRASPAELMPGESANLEALLVDPSRPGKNSTLLWVGCEADPFNENRSVCADPDLVTDPSRLTGGSGQLPKGVSIIGFNNMARYTTSKTLFNVLPADDVRRLNGTVAQVVVIAVAEEVSPAAPREELEALFARVQKKELKSVVGIYRLRISENSERNSNPKLTHLTLGTERWPLGSRIPIKQGVEMPMELVATDDSFEAFSLVTPSGIEKQTERLLVAWYSTAGLFTEERVAIGAEVKSVFKSPNDTEKNKIPERRVGQIHAVVRDTRGGQTFVQNRFFVCDDSLPQPAITSVLWPSMHGEAVRIAGTNLENLLDVFVDGIELERPAYSTTQMTFEAYFPSGMTPGTKRGFVTTKTCARLPLSN
jgi:hypothetical protein